MQRANFEVLPFLLEKRAVTTVMRHFWNFGSNCIPNNQQQIDSD